MRTGFHEKEPVDRLCKSSAECGTHNRRIGGGGEIAGGGLTHPDETHHRVLPRRPRMEASACDRCFAALNAPRRDLSERQIMPGLGAPIYSRV